MQCLGRSTTNPLPPEQAAHTFPIVVVVPAQPSLSRVQQRTESIKTLVVDRQPLFVAALGRLLSSLPISSRVVTAGRSDVALDMVRGESVSLVCCELHATPITGLELVRILSDERPELPVVLLGDVGDETQLAAAMVTNVAGLFTKSADPVEFLAGVSAVLSGHRAIGSGIISLFTARLASPVPQEARRLGNQLSPTELEILAMIGQAQSIPTIAASRGISHKTVRNHLAKIYRKLELHGRTEAMLWAARMGLTGS
jgi:DNA-binding NarL/FixJ family response regulator